MPPRIAHALGAAVVVIGLGTSANAAGARVVVATYTGASTQAPVVYQGADVAGTRLGAAIVQTRSSERTLRISATDRSGVPVGGEALQRGTDGSVLRLGSFCGATRTALKLARPGATVTVQMLAGPCGAGTSLPATGTIKATLSR